MIQSPKPLKPLPIHPATLVPYSFSKFPAASRPSRNSLPQSVLLIFSIRLLNNTVILSQCLKTKIEAPTIAPIGPSKASIAAVSLEI